MVSGGLAMSLNLGMHKCIDFQFLELIWPKKSTKKTDDLGYSQEASRLERKPRPELHVLVPYSNPVPFLESVEAPVCLLTRT